jgi:hypothetical protein
MSLEKHRKISTSITTFSFGRMKIDTMSILQRLLQKTVLVLFDLKKRRDEAFASSPLEQTNRNKPNYFTNVNT